MSLHSGTTRIVVYLQCVEQFYKESLVDYRPPINLNEWFRVIEVQKKREDISRLIALLHEKENNGNVLPTLNLPTRSGILIQQIDCNVSISMCGWLCVRFPTNEH